MILKCSEYITEKLGVSLDGEILSDYLIEFLSKAKPGELYVFVNNDANDLKNVDNAIVVKNLPKLEKKIYKIIVDYSIKDMGGTQAYFDQMRLPLGGYFLIGHEVYDCNH